MNSRATCCSAGVAFDWNQERQLRLLGAHGIACVAAEHAPVVTMAESARLGLSLKGSRCKNPAVRDKSGTRNLIVVAPPDKAVDLGGLGRELGVGRLSLCPHEELPDLLGVRPGALSPLALVADGPSARFTLVLDRAVAQEPFLLVHPDHEGRRVSSQACEIRACSAPAATSAWSRWRSRTAC